MRRIGDEAFEISECLPFLTPLPGGWMGENNPMEGNLMGADLPCNTLITISFPQREVRNRADPAALIVKDAVNKIMECHGDTRYPAGL